MLNKMILQGRFIKDLEKKEISTGVVVCNFTLAWNKRYRDKEYTLFLNCVAFGGTAEFITKYFKKCDTVIVEGELISKNYEDSQGNKRYFTEMKVNEVHFCGSKRNNSDEKEMTEDGDLAF